MRRNSTRPWILAAGLFAGCVLPVMAQAQAAPTGATGVVVGTVDVRFQAAKGLLGKMSESTRSRKWTLRLALADDRGVAYRVQDKLEVREGAVRPFVLTLPAGTHRFVDATNELSGGLEHQTVPLDATFEVVGAETRYLGRLRVLVVGKVMYVLATKEAVDCREADLALVRDLDPTVAAIDVATALMRVPPDAGGPATTPGDCGAAPPTQ